MKLDYTVNSLNEIKSSRQGGVFSSIPDKPAIKRSELGVPSNLQKATMTTKATSSNMTMKQRVGSSHVENSIAVMTSDKSQRDSLRNFGWNPYSKADLSLQKVRKNLSNTDRLDFVSNSIHNTAFQNLTPQDKQTIQKIAYNEDAVANMQAQKADTPTVQGSIKQPINTQQNQQGANQNG